MKKVYFLQTPKVRNWRTSNVRSHSRLLLGVSIMRNAVDSEINDVFNGGNTYGHRLSDQERRQSGIQSHFADLVRELACEYRGDVSRATLPPYEMPSISIDLPKTRHGYDIKSEDVFWVNQGILRATDLRDSLDEQCLSDIVACVVGQDLISRSKSALDALYDPAHAEYNRIEAALETYGAQKVSDKIKYCIEQILQVCAFEQPEKLRRIIFSNPTTNASPSVFAVLLLAFHELIVGEQKVVADWSGLRKSLDNICDRMESGQGGANPEQRCGNIDVIRRSHIRHFIRNPKMAERIYADHKVVDIESDIRRSTVETSCYELKQGVLDLTEGATDPRTMLSKIPMHICAIANNGKGVGGKLMIGVLDSQADAERVKALHGVEARHVGSKFIVGVRREADAMGISVEKYFQMIRDAIAGSGWSENLRSSVLATIDFNSYYGLGLLVIAVWPQEEMSYLNDDVYYRSGDQTLKAQTAKEVGMVAARFR